jgi:four helix bundle protein
LLSVECTKATCGFPGGERHPLAEQLLRACYSVPLNIAEGSGRKGAREFRRFLDIARGSLLEVQSAIDIARELGYVTAESYARLDSVASETGRTLWGLLRSVSDRARRR